MWFFLSVGGCGGPVAGRSAVPRTPRVRFLPAHYPKQLVRCVCVNEQDPSLDAYSDASQMALMVFEVSLKKTTVTVPS